MRQLQINPKPVQRTRSLPRRGLVRLASSTASASNDHWGLRSIEPDITSSAAAASKVRDLLVRVDVRSALADYNVEDLACSQLERAICFGAETSTEQATELGTATCSSICCDSPRSRRRDLKGVNRSQHLITSSNQ